MPIAPGSDWGEIVATPETTVRCADDSEVAARLRIDPGAAFVVTGGNLWRALGLPSAPTGERCRRLPMDALRIGPDGDSASIVAVDSVVVRRRLWRGGALRGRVLVVSNSGLRAGRILLPRAHPNDGRWDRLRVSAEMGVKERLMAWRRARRGDHLPHPGLSVDSTDEFEIDVAPGEVLLVDGRRHRMTAGERSRARVEADRWHLHVASPTV